MKTSLKMWCWFGLFCAIALILLTWLRPRADTQKTGPPVVPVSVSTPSHPTGFQEQITQPEAASGNLTPRAPGLADTTWNYILRLYTVCMAENNPLQFHGRMLDQNDEPVVGAKITVSHTWYDTMWMSRAYPKPPAGSESGVPVLEAVNVLTTASDGGFHLTGDQATGVSIRTMEKEGYVWNIGPGWLNLNFSGRFMGHNPAQWPAYMKTNGDFVIRVWKKGLTEPLVLVSQIVPLKMPTFEDLRVNLLTQSHDNPDLIIKMPLLFPHDPNRTYDRQIIVETVQGEISETANEFPYLAPASGYLGSWETKLTPSDPKYDGGGWKKNFFVRLRKGKITGSISIHFDVPSACFVFSGYFNPTGSRNLEPDPEKLITDPEEIRRIDEETQVK